MAFSDNRTRVLSAIGALIALGLHTGHANATASVTCSGPGGYCSPGSHMTVTASSSNLIPDFRGLVPSTDSWIAVAYCSTGDEITCDGCSDGRCLVFLNKIYIPWGDLFGTTPWSKWDGAVNITRTLNTVPVGRGDKYCVSAFAHAGYASNYKYADYGETEVIRQYRCIAPAPPPPPPDLCTVASPNPITVEFGSVERSTIAVGTGGGGDIRKTLTIQCMGPDTHGITVRLAMVPTSWSNGQIATSNPSLGVGISADGQPLNNNDSFTMNVNGSGTANFIFSLLRDPNKQPADIATGNFCASATLIVTEP